MSICGNALPNPGSLLKKIFLVEIIYDGKCISLICEDDPVELWLIDV